VHNLCIVLAVGEAQLPQNKYWCAFPAMLLATMKSQQAVAKRFCWKARQSFDVPFFWVSQRVPSRPVWFGACHFTA
jgi:hypothetical protein